ncbi:aminotransferase class I/II-fold pyridoxal phosphate-dependent enzyme [Sungkyunkwania multivorans]|uniref:Aminotransferase class I/II-fold pyridoxal phosphate-dependent enzyme n=1 Tax=Sungkyunkwania multivorans TaxID=1173618 RepID=A0ABW3D054_9FLAO
MGQLPEKLLRKLELRKENNAFRQLPNNNSLVDLSSNDYLGLAKNEALYDSAHKLLVDQSMKLNGATGSRLLSGNHPLYDRAELMISKFHQAEAALIFNSGYDANIGLFSSVPQRGDIILYDELIHASIRDGIKMSNAKAYKFRHNDIADIGEILKKLQQAEAIYVVTESVFSMDGDTPDLKKLAAFCHANNLKLIVDEAHAVGVFGFGLTQENGIAQHIFATVITFGKALGCHGAAILGSTALKDYLVNFSRSLIYTTGLPPHSLATILSAYEILEQDIRIVERLRENIEFFNMQIEELQIRPLFIPSESSIHCAIIPGNKKVKEIAKKIQEKGFDVRAILSPTVPEGAERLRFCLHSYNSKEDISGVLQLLIDLI